MDRTTEDGTAEWRSPMVDVSGLSLDELAAQEGDSALVRAMRRLSAERTEPSEPIAGFNSAL
ncbi:FxSxx-COOH cyclophane-containing RiPP peptide [Actinoplanes sp. NPDC026619]|uniref:FxSxx-COOH cyclophane-containing RiPP peptide n=1 Tax=Actinoplanes sp. NPDC026619 TaxID=3155798 RepID=UPI0034067C6F